MDWLLLTLVSAFALASADAAQKYYLKGYSGIELIVVRFGVAGILLLPVSLMNEAPPISLEFVAWMVILVPLELYAMWLYVAAIRDAPLHLTVPYLAFTPVINVATGFLVLGESVTLFGLVGIVLVVAGTYILNLRRDAPWYAPFSAVLQQQGSRRMLLAAIIYSFTSVGSKAAMAYTTPWVFGPLYFVVTGFVVLAAAAIVRPKTLAVLRKNVWQHVVVGGFMAVMVVTHFIAIAKVEVAYFITVKRSSMLFGILFGALFFGERNLAKNFVAGMIMTAGVLLVALA